jgi:trk system potassium uptake protein
MPREAGGRLERVPLIVLLLGMTGLAMLLPAVHGLVLREHAVARAFAYSALLVTGLALLLALATAGRPLRPVARGLLPVLTAIYVVVPAAMALPLTEALGMPFADAWFEMVSSFTTTGATLIEAPRRLPDPVHLWRGIAGWAGGLFVLVSALAFLAPLRLGGFELLRPEARGRIEGAPAPQVERRRLGAALALVLPWYAGLTGAVWLLLAMMGMAPFPALMLAMAALSTSGILPRESLGAIGFLPELVLAMAMALSLSRGLSVPGSLPGTGGRRGRLGPLRRDPELRLAVVVVGAVVLLVVARHLGAAFEAGAAEDVPTLGATAWGAAFTGLSFLTTTGFVSHDWIVARAWSNLTPPGLVLVGLALIGGGVATTAGGVKLLRVYAMTRLGGLEMERLIHPRMVDPGTETQRFLAGAGARAAWLFAMVFAIVGVALLGGMMLTGATLEEGLILVIAALTTTGPLVEVAGVGGLTWVGQPEAARLVLAGAMILGRLEILVILALALAQVARD